MYFAIPHVKCGGALARSLFGFLQPAQAPIKRDSSNAGNGISTHRGFTLIELMITISIVAIITSLALPSYQTSLEKRQITSGAVQVGAFLSAVQIESIRRNDSIAVTYSHFAGDSWCVGNTIGTTACDCTITDISNVNACLIGGKLSVISDDDLSHPEVMNSMTGDGSFVYDTARGVMLDHADQATFHFQSSAGTYALNVEITAIGRVKICSKDSTTQVPGFALCS